MFFHGGGWILGDYPTHKRLVRDLVVNSGAVAVFPDYTPSPEARFPVAINQAYAATKWVAENDILHDEGVAYGRKLDDAGVPTTVSEYKGFIHDYGMLNPLAHIPAVQESVLDAAIALRKALFAK